MADLIKEFAKHFPKGLSKDIQTYMIDHAFLASRYIFTRREGKQQYAYCTHCRKEYKTNGSLRQGDKTYCQKCGSQCKVKSGGRGRKSMVDQAYFVYYEKSKVNPQAIVARGIHAFRDYRGDYKKVRTGWTTIAFYLFEPGKPGVNVQASSYFMSQEGKIGVWWWKECKSVFENPIIQKSWLMSDTYSRDSIEKSVIGTPFAWSGWDKYDIGDMTKFFDLFSRYPCIEYLTKLGFTSLVQDRLEGNKTFGAINWHGKNLFKVLKLTKHELNEVKNNHIHIDCWTLFILQWSKKSGVNFTVTEAADFANACSEFYFEEMKKLFTYGTVREIIRYLNKQCSQKDKEHYHSMTYTITTWRDYLVDARKLGLDLTSKNVIFPRNLYRAHQNTIKQIKYREDKLLNQKIKARNKELKKYYFEHNGLLIRAAMDTAELILEGKVLNHCVGGYANRHASGQCTILFIRKIDEPDKPYFTVEVAQNQVIQCRGLRNCAQDNTVKAFVEEFKKKRLKQKKEKNKVKVPA